MCTYVFLNEKPLCFLEIFLSKLDFRTLQKIHDFIFCVMFYFDCINWHLLKKNYNQATSDLWLQMEGRYSEQQFELDAQEFVNAACSWSICQDIDPFLNEIHLRLAHSWIDESGVLWNYNVLYDHSYRCPTLYFKACRKGNSVRSIFLIRLRACRWQNVGPAANSSMLHKHNSIRRSHECCHSAG